ncbi:MAG: hypothetical protein JWP75_3620 [Frondihabitans sp.]|nr:hypothetical protein [Frondihabitans sp.]
MPSDWIEHRRNDGESVGWIRPEADDFVAIDLLGRPVSGIVDWLTAEEALEEAGIGYLADPYELLLDDGTWLRVRLTQVSSEIIRLKKDDWGAIDSPQVDYTVPFPLPETVRTLA